MLDPYAIAVGGVGTDPLNLAVDGFLASVQTQAPIVVVPEVRQRAPLTVRGSGGGGGTSFLSDVISTRARAWVIPPLEEEIEEEADLILFHVPETAVIKAVADGVLKTFVDNHGRRAMVIDANDGTRYWYADVGEYIAENGAQVSTGQPIGRTKPGAPVLPAHTEATGLRGDAEGPSGGKTPRRRVAQGVFVQTSLAAKIIAMIEREDGRPPKPPPVFVRPRQPPPELPAEQPKRYIAAPIRRPFLGETAHAPDPSVRSTKSERIIGASGFLVAAAAIWAIVAKSRR